MCQNDAMKSRLIEKSLYERWQKWGTLYGISKYSFVMLTNAGDSEKYLYDYVETIYVRMIELCLVQRASILRFSSEVTSLSHLDTNDKMLSKKISSLYQSYIRFVNQIHFREITAQEQGIEIYKMIYEQMDLKIHIDKLDEEIQELHNHISLRNDRKTNSEMAHLTLIATIFVPLSFLVGLFGMNNSDMQDMRFIIQIIWLISFLLGSLILFKILSNRLNKN